jgi:hypothetical protein
MRAPSARWTSTSAVGIRQAAAVTSTNCGELGGGGGIAATALPPPTPLQGTGREPQLFGDTGEG